MEVDGPSSLPSDYVTILHLKERWLKQQQQQSSSTIKPKPNDSPSPPASKTLNDVVVPPPKPDSVSKTHNDVVPVKRNTHQSINKPKVDVTSSHSHDDSASKTHNDVVSVRKIPYRVNNKPKPDDGSASFKNPDDVIPRQAVNKIKPGDDSASSKIQTPNDVVSRQVINELKPDVVKTQDGSASKVSKKKPYRRNNKPKPESEAEVQMHGSASKTVVERVDNNDEKQEEEGDKTDELKSKQPATKKKSSKSRNPRLIVNQILMEQKNEHVKEKKQQEQRPEEVWEPKGEKETFSGNVSVDVDVGETVRNVAAAGVKEMNVGQRSHSRGRGGGGGRDSRGFRGGSRNGASFGVHKGQMNMNMNNCVWVKKGESLST